MASRWNKRPSKRPTQNNRNRSGPPTNGRPSNANRDTPRFRSLTEFLSYIRKNLVNVDAGTAIGEITKLVGRQVNVRYETVTTDAPFPADPSASHKYFKHLADKNISRIILCSKKDAHANQFERELSGVVLQYPTWEVLSLPPQSFAPAKRSVICKNISKYRIYAIEDGTVLTLYNYQSNWVLSSSNAYDVTNMQWISGITYDAALAELASQFPEFKLESLSTTRCYTIGMRHHSMQPLTADTQKVWFISDCDLASVNSGVIKIIRSGDYIGLPYQPIVEFDDTLEPEQIIDTISHYNKTALADYMATQSQYHHYTHSDSAPGSDSSTDGTVETRAVTPTICYGYIFRSTVDSIPSVIFPSDLLMWLRNNVYDMPKKRKDGERFITFDNRRHYIALKAYLNPESKYQFITMFPNEQSKYDSFNVEIGQLIQLVISEMRQPTYTTNYMVRTIHGVLTNAKISVADPEISHIVMDFARDPQYLEMYFKHLSCIPSEEKEKTEW
jgi:hypothetical protein